MSNTRVSVMSGSMKPNCVACNREAVLVLKGGERVGAIDSEETREVARIECPTCPHRLPGSTARVFLDKVFGKEVVGSGASTKVSPGALAEDDLQTFGFYPSPA